MYRFSFLVLFFNVTSFCCAQEISFFDSLILESDKNGLFAIAVDSENNYYFESINNDKETSTTSIIKTNQNLEVLDVWKDIKINGNFINSISLFSIVNNALLLSSTVENNEPNYLYTHSTDLNFEDHQLLDSTLLISNTKFISPSYKNDANGNFYSVGSTENNGNILANHYVEIEREGKIVNFESINNMNERISSFSKNSKSGYLFINTVPTMSFLLNEELQVVDQEIIFYNVENLTAGFNSYSCEFTDSLSIQNFNVGIFDNEYTSSAAKYSIIEDSISLDKVTPLHFGDNETDNVVWSVMAKDELDNTYLAYQERYNPLNDEIDPNRVFIIKVDKELNRIYEHEFFNGNEYILSNSIVDKKGDFVATGVYFQPADPSINKNFIIKINSKGEVQTNIIEQSTLNEIALYPNPCQDFISLESKESLSDINYSILSLDGQLIKTGQAQFNSSTMNLDVSDLLEGMYVLHIVSEQIFYVGRFVKG